MMPVPSNPLDASQSSSWTTIAAPTGPPHSVPMPPRTVMSTTLPDVVQFSSCSDANPCEMANTPPASPARPAEMTKTTILYRFTSYPSARARAGLSRIATSTRPNGLLTTRQAMNIPMRMKTRPA
jgi:hypothetical protein